MSGITYEVYYFEGLKPGVDPAQAIQQLAKLLKIDLERAEKLITATDRVVKAGLTREQAEKYIHALDKLGMQVKMQTQQQSELSLVEIEPEPDNKAESEPEVVQTLYTHSVTVNSDQPKSTDEEPDHVTSGAHKDVAVEFHGKGMEYFKIWIVNIFLTILTLGIYSAWAKVRNKQYFYGNTLIEGSSFQYTASPVAILKGRLIAVGLFVLYSVIAEFVPVLAVLFMLVFLAFLPWLIVRSLAFNARNSVYRNIRFNFTGKPMDALKAFVLWPMLVPFTLGLILPLTWYKQTRFIIANSAYGTTPFTFHAQVSDYYRIFFIGLGGLIAAGILASILMLLLGPLATFVSPLFALGYVVLIAYFVAALANLYFNSIQLKGHSFTSTLEFIQVAWIYFSNMLAILFSVGLLIPWAQVRMARYRAACLTMHIQDSLDDFVAAEQQNVSALGEEMGEVFDVEVSFI